MLRHAAGMNDEPHARPEPQDLASEVERLLADAREWARAERTLARLELADLKSQLVKAAAISAIAAAALLCMFIALTQAAIAFVAAQVNGAATAAIIVAAGFAVVAGIALLVAKRAIAWRADSIFLRWLARRGR